MNVYVFNEKYLNKITLPKRVSGAYQIFGKNDFFIGNVEEKDGVWRFVKGDNVHIEYQNSDTVVEYVRINILDTINQDKYVIYTLPSYDDNDVKYISIKETVSIGNGNDFDINYGILEFFNESINLKYQNGFWILQTKLNCVYINNNQVKNTVIYNGDYLFFYGLKIIFYGNRLSINNPNNLVKLKAGSFNKAKNNSVFKVIDSNVPEDMPVYSKEDYFFKSPRFDSVIELEEVKIKPPPAANNSEKPSLLLTMGPQLTMICTSGVSIANTVYNFTKQGRGNTTTLLLSIGTMVVTMVGSFLWPTVSRKINQKNIKKKEAKRKKKYSEYLARKKQEINNIKSKQKQILIENSITTNKIIEAISSRNRILWEKSIAHDDFLQLRLGIGTVATKIKVDVPEEEFSIEETDTLYTNFQDIVNDSLMLENVPQTIALTKDYITAIVGNDEVLLTKFINNFFLQIMALHSYSDLKIIVYTENPDKWNYLKVIPHVWSNLKDVRYFATSIEELIEVTTDLEKAFDNRIIADESEKKEDDGEEAKDEEIYKNYQPYYLIFTDSIMSIRDVPFIKKILKYKLCSTL